MLWHRHPPYEHRCTQVTSFHEKENPPPFHPSSSKLGREDFMSLGIDWRKQKDCHPAKIGISGSVGNNDWQMGKKRLAGVNGGSFDLMHRRRDERGVWESERGCLHYCHLYAFLISRSYGGSWWLKEINPKRESREVLFLSMLEDIISQLHGLRTWWGLPW